VETPRPDSSIGDLFSQLVDDGRNLLGAEANLYKQIARDRAARARPAIIAIAAGGLLAFAGLIAALVGLVMGIAILIGPIAAGLVVLVLCGGIGWLLVHYGMSRLAAISGKEGAE
jgi:drug/metabolite transporter (DMT)-like permease